MLDESVLEKIGLDKYIENDVIKTLESSRKICIDVGLSYSAPNSGAWLLNDSERCVIAIEPLAWHWEGLNGAYDDDKNDPGEGWAVPRLNTNSIYVGGKQVVNIENKFFWFRMCY